MNGTAMRLFLGVFSVFWTASLSGGRAADDPWPDIRKELFGTRVIAENAVAIEIFAPNQADDAAMVPITISIPASFVVVAKSLTLIIDRNPVPVAATFVFGDGYRISPNIGDRLIATRIRVDAFSRVRVIAETNDGSLYMTSKFVIGSGGCSAPASKDPSAALAELGKTHLIVRQDDANGSDWREARIMIKHPNFTGMQMNAKTGAYTPARFVNSINVKQGNSVIWSMQGGISISEDPNIRFTFATSAPADLEFTATDTAGKNFKASAPMAPPS